MCNLDHGLLVFSRCCIVTEASLQIKYSVSKTLQGLQSSDQSLANTLYISPFIHSTPDDQHGIAFIPISTMILEPQFNWHTLNNHHILKTPLFLFSFFRSFIFLILSSLCLPLNYHLTWLVILSLCSMRLILFLPQTLTMQLLCPSDLGIILEKLSACPIFSDSKYSLLKSYPSNIIAHRCNQLAKCTGIPFFEPNIAKSGLWSVEQNYVSFYEIFFIAKIITNAPF